MKVKKIVYLGLLISAAIILHVIEFSFPYFVVPWAKLGLPNIIVIFALIFFGIKEGLYITIARVTLGGFITGLLFSPVFLMSIAGGISSTLVMWACLPLLKKKFTLVTVSIIGALTHIVSQFAVVYLLFFEDLMLTKSGIMFTSPWFFIFALPAGFLTGMAANSIIFHLKKIEPDLGINTEMSDER